MIENDKRVENRRTMKVIILQNLIWHQTVGIASELNLLSKLIFQEAHNYCESRLSSVRQNPKHLLTNKRWKPSDTERPPPSRPVDVTCIITLVPSALLSDVDVCGRISSVNEAEAMLWPTWVFPIIQTKAVLTAQCRLLTRSAQHGPTDGGWSHPRLPLCFRQILLLRWRPPGRVGKKRDASQQTVFLS